jgi:serine/threonine protein kinase
VAEIFRARSLGAAGFEKIVAIKRIQPDLENERDFVAMFTEEARISASLTHANIAQVIEFGRVDGAHYLAMEYLNGMSLAQLLRHFVSTGQTMPLPLALHIGHAVSGALAYAHSRSDASGRSLDILHLGVNPQNVLISFEGAVKLTDFGIGRARAKLTGHDVEDDDRLAYMAPEQLSGNAVDARSDVYALGCVLYACVTGRPPFQAEDGETTEQRIQRGVYEPPRRVNQEIPEAAEQIILRAIAVAPNDRFQSAAELERAIEEFAHQTRVTFNAKQLARWMIRNFPPESRRRSAARDAADGKGRQTRPLSATRPGAVSVPMLVRGHERGPVGSTRSSAESAARESPAASTAKASRSLKTTAPGRTSAQNDRAVESAVQETGADPTTRPEAASREQARARIQADLAGSQRGAHARTRLGLGSPAPVSPDEHSSPSPKAPSNQDVRPPLAHATRGDTLALVDDGRGLDQLLSPVEPDPGGTVNLSEADLQEAEFEELSSDARSVAGEAHAELGETAPMLDAIGDAASLDSASADAGPDAVAMQWDDGPTILDPRDEAAFEAVARAEAEAVASDEHPPMDQDPPDGETRVEAVPAALLHTTLLDQDQPHQLEGDGPTVLDSAPPAGAESTEMPGEPDASAVAQEQAQAEAGALDEAAQLEPPDAASPGVVPLQPPEPGMGILLPALAIVSLILLIAGVVLVYVLLSQTTDATATSSVEIIPPSAEPVPPIAVRPLQGERTNRATNPGAAPPAAAAPADAATPGASVDATANMAKAPASSSGQSSAGEPSTPETKAKRAPQGSRSSQRSAEGTSRGSGLVEPAAPPAARHRATNTGRASRSATNTRTGRQTTAAKTRRAPTSAEAPAVDGNTDRSNGTVGYLIIASRPRAMVLINGRKSGRQTPIRPNNPLRLRPGTHRITLVARGRKFSYTVTVRRDQVTRLVRVLPLP